MAEDHGPSLPRGNEAKCRSLNDMDGSTARARSFSPPQQGLCASLSREGFGYVTGPPSKGDRKSPALLHPAAHLSP